MTVLVFYLGDAVVTIVADVYNVPVGTVDTPHAVKEVVLVLKGACGRTLLHNRTSPVVVLPAHEYPAFRMATAEIAHVVIVQDYAPATLLHHGETAVRVIVKVGLGVVFLDDGAYPMGVLGVIDVDLSGAFG